MPTVSTANVNGVRAAAAKDAVVQRAGAHDRRWSDHAPVTVRYAP